MVYWKFLLNLNFFPFPTRYLTEKNSNISPRYVPFFPSFVHKTFTFGPCTVCSIKRQISLVTCQAGTQIILSLTWTLGGGAWSAPSSGRSVSWKGTLWYCTGGWVGPRAGLHNTGKFHPCWLLYTPALCTLYAVTCSDCRWTSYGVRMKFIESNIILAYFLFIYLHLRKNICPCVVNHYQLCKLLLSHELKSCILQTSSLFTPELLIYALYDVTMSKTV